MNKKHSLILLVGIQAWSLEALDTAFAKQMRVCAERRVPVGRFDQSQACVVIGAVGVGCSG